MATAQAIWPLKRSYYVFIYPWGCHIVCMQKASKGIKPEIYSKVNYSPKEDIAFKTPAAHCPQHKNNFCIMPAWWLVLHTETGNGQVTALSSFFPVRAVSTCRLLKETAAKSVLSGGDTCTAGLKIIYTVLWTSEGVLECLVSGRCWSLWVAGSDDVATLRVVIGFRHAASSQNNFYVTTRMGVFQVEHCILTRWAVFIHVTRQ